MDEQDIQQNFHDTDPVQQQEEFQPGLDMEDVSEDVTENFIEDQPIIDKHFQEDVEKQDINVDEGNFNEIELPQVDIVEIKEEKELEQKFEVETKEEVHPETEEIV